MKVINSEKLDKSVVRLTIQVEAAEFVPVVRKVFEENRKNLNVHGFRKGKVPFSVAEQMYGASFHAEAVQRTFQAMAEQGIAEAGLKAVTNLDYMKPNIENLNSKGYQLTLMVPVEPEVTLGTYMNVRAPKYRNEVGESEVQRRLEELQERASTTRSLDHPAQLGDTVVMDYEGFVDGSLFDGGKAENFSLKLGSGEFIPGFEDGLVGVSAGEEREINVTFPEQYRAKELAGKAAVFKTKVHNVVEVIVPEMDDEFAKDVSEFDTLEELRESIRKEITDQREVEIERNFEDAVIAQVIRNSVCDVSEAQIQMRSSEIMQNLNNQLTQQGYTMEKYLKDTNTTPELLSYESHYEAVNQLMREYVLGAVAEAENMQVDEETLEAQVEEEKKEFQIPDERVEDLRKLLRKSLLVKQAEELVLQNAVAVEAQAFYEELQEKRKAEAAAKAAEEAAAQAEAAPAEDANAEAAPAEETNAEAAPAEETNAEAAPAETPTEEIPSGEEPNP